MDHCAELNSMDTTPSIVVVTHTIPHARGVNWIHGAENLGVGCFGNKKWNKYRVFSKSKTLVVWTQS